MLLVGEGAGREKFTADMGRSVFPGFNRVGRGGGRSENGSLGTAERGDSTIGGGLTTGERGRSTACTGIIGGSSSVGLINGDDLEVLTMMALCPSAIAMLGGTNLTLAAAGELLNMAERGRSANMLILGGGMIIAERGRSPG